MSQSLPEPVAIRERREQTIAALCDHFARDRLSLEEFESRLDRAHVARVPADLEVLVADLITPTPAAAPAPQQVAHPAGQDDTRFIISIMGGVERKGRWRPGSRNLVLTLMAGTELDFRDTPLPSGVTDVYIFACMGGVDIIVPPDLAVETHGFAFMGGFGHTSDGPPVRPDAPVLRVHGFALMGGVDINVRLQGESARDAKSRRRDERRERRDNERLRRGR